MKKNIIEEQTINYAQLKKLFPHAVSMDESGKYTIDPQKLQMSLDPSKAEIHEDGYGLNLVGKKEAYHNAFSKNYKVLKPLKDDSKNWDSTENILIKGDNLDALKILRHNYFEAIKMIYIDPPYNTKNDGFVYNDNFTCTTEAFVWSDIISDELQEKKECEHINVYSQNISDDNFTPEIQSNISKIGIKSDKLRFRG